MKVFVVIRSIPPYLLQNLIWIPTRLILKFFVSFKVEGIDNLKAIKGPVIFVANHSSELDPVLLPASLPIFSRFLPIFYVSREKTFYDPTFLKRLFYGGLFFKLWGAYPAKVGLQSYDAALKYHEELLLNGASVMIFPEGKIAFDPNTPHEAKGGAAYLAHYAQATVVPLAINGAHRIKMREFFGFKRKIRIIIGSPIPYAKLFRNDVEVSPDQYKQIAKQLMATVYEMKSLTSEFENDVKKIIHA